MPEYFCMIAFKSFPCCHKGDVVALKIVLLPGQYVSKNYSKWFWFFLTYIKQIIDYTSFFQACLTLGTTGVCAFDNLPELGPVCMFWLSFLIQSNFFPVPLNKWNEVKYITQAQKTNYGSTLMPRMLRRRFCVQSCAGQCRVSNMPIHWSSTRPSGWWSMVTV